MTYSYRTQGVCSQKITFSLENGIVSDVTFYGGCNGNIKGIAKLVDGTIAGSSSTLWRCVKTVTEMGIPFDDAVRMASTTPAEMLGISKGKIEPEYDADLLILDENNEIKTVIIGGEIFK